MGKIFLIMDGRANYDPDKALVMEVCKSRKEAEKHKVNYGIDCVVVEAEEEGKHG